MGEFVVVLGESTELVRLCSPVLSPHPANCCPQSQHAPADVWFPHFPLIAPFFLSFFNHLSEITGNYLQYCKCLEAI